MFWEPGYVSVGLSRILFSSVFHRHEMQLHTYVTCQGDQNEFVDKVAQITAQPISCRNEYITFYRCENKPLNFGYF
jgi:hypothetical protein